MKPGGPFGFEALCGAMKPADYPLLTTSTETSVNCDDCKRIAGDAQQNEEQVPPERIWRISEGDTFREWAVVGTPLYLNETAVEYVRADPIAALLKEVEPGTANYDAVSLIERMRRVCNRLHNAPATTGAVSIPDAERLRAAAEEIAIKYLRPSVLGSNSWDNAVDQVVAILERRLLVGPSTPDAISEVEKMRDEWAAVDLGFEANVQTANAIIARLRALSPSVGVGTGDAP
jgi:hypothetical protein